MYTQQHTQVEDCGNSSDVQNFKYTYNVFYYISEDIHLEI